MSEDLKKGYLREAKPATKRYCQYLRLVPDKLKEYKYWHKSKNIWKEIPQGIREVGILDMEIYIFDDFGFMILETPVDFDWNDAFSRLASLERQAEWEDFVSQFQEVEKGKKSNEKWQLVERVFSLKEALE